MRAHHWTVPLLTEMDPAQHTTYSGRTLGLNRNGGEVIELRLRTDAGDGYRNYAGIRKTLCHELAHNVWGEHDANFWALCKQIERDVDRADWRSGGRALTDQHFYTPDEQEQEDDDDGLHDHGGWTGGEFVLGGATESASVAPTTSRSNISAQLASRPVNRRDILAQAAEERLRRQKQIGHDQAQSPHEGEYDGSS